MCGDATCIPNIAPCYCLFTGTLYIYICVHKTKTDYYIKSRQYVRPLIKWQRYRNRDEKKEKLFCNGLMEKLCWILIKIYYIWIDGMGLLFRMVVSSTLSFSIFSGFPQALNCTLYTQYTIQNTERSVHCILSYNSCHPQLFLQFHHSISFVSFPCSLICVDSPKML